MSDTVLVSRHEGLLIVHCHGDLDLATRDGLLAAVSGLARRAGQGGSEAEGIVIDLTGVTFLDCTALNVLLSLARACGRAGAGLVFAGPPPIARRLITALELDRVLVLADTVAEGIALAHAWAGLAEADRHLSALLRFPSSTARRTRSRPGPEI